MDTAKKQGTVLQNDGILLSNGKMKVLGDSKISKFNKGDIITVGIENLKEQSKIFFYKNGLFIGSSILLMKIGERKETNKEKIETFSPVCCLYRWAKKEIRIQCNFGKSDFHYPIKNFCPLSN